MLSRSYTYQSTLKDALKVNWQVEDLIGGSNRLDFTKSFLPETMAGIEEIQCLNASEKLKLNHIRGNSYLHLFVLVEEFIIPMVLERVQQMGFGNIYATQALLCFAEEESKHIHLFQRFAEEFERSFGISCACIGPIQELAATILNHHPLSVLLFTLQFEWTTQSHYLESIRENQSELDPRFCSLLKHHWLEEAQHTKLDTLLIYEAVQSMSAADITTTVDEYLEIAKFLDAGLMQQVQLDLESLSKAIDRPLSAAEKQEIQRIQAQSYRWTFICAGMTHPNFIQILSDISPDGKARVLQMVKALS